MHGLQACFKHLNTLLLLHSTFMLSVVKMLLKGEVEIVMEITFLAHQLANHNQISSGASLGWGIDCFRFWVRSDQNSGFHGNR